MLPRTILKLLMILAALLFLVDKAAACSCYGARQDPGFHPVMVYWSNDAVFTGQVVEISSATPDKPVYLSQKVVHFSVDKAFKGVDDRTIDIVTNPSTPSCGYDFKQGVKGGSIVGAVIRYERSDVKDYGTRSPVSGVEVVLEQGEDLAKTMTNREGKYEFHGLSVGTYRVRAALPTGLRVLSADGKPKDHCVNLYEQSAFASESFIITNTSSLSGRLVTPEGSSLPQQYLALVPLDEKGKEISSALTPDVVTVPQKGSYYFRDVAPGRYLLAVNPRNRPGKSDPVYPLMYYPGVLSREEAKVIEVSSSREMSLNDFMLTRPLAERWFSGVVLLADKTAAAGAKVILIDPNDRMMGTNVTEVIADAEGRFRLKGYESFPYWIDAYFELGGIPMFAPPVQLSTSGSVAAVELVISLNYRAQPYHK